MPFLQTKFGQLLVSAILNWVADQLADKIKRAKIMATHKRDLEKIITSLKTAETETERERATDELARNSF